jgi:hypothetical protein
MIYKTVCLQFTNHMRVSVAQFCGYMGWLVVWQSLFCSPFAARSERAPTDVCLITQCELREIGSAVQADDGRIYDAAALRVWLQKCHSTDRPACVIPTQVISEVWPVRTYSLLPRWWYAWRRKRGASHSVTQLPKHVSVGTQTDLPSKRQKRQCVCIPSERSAFLTVTRN